MAASDYSIVPSNNTLVAGKNIGEGATAPSSINDVLRQFAADLKGLDNDIPDTATLLAKSGGTMTGNITYTGRGAFTHMASSGLTDGRIFVQVEGSALPSASDGAIVFFYT